MKTYNPSEFTSDPRATMDSLRKEAAEAVRTQLLYLQTRVETAREMGLKVTFKDNNSSRVMPALERIWLDQAPIEY